MIISRAILTDIPQICQLVNNAYRGDEAKKGWTYETDLIEGTKRTDENDLKFLFSKENAIFLVAKNENGELFGVVYLENKLNIIYLGMLSVNPNFQGNGIGKKLIEKAKEFAKSSGIDKIQIQVVHLRTELIKWYEKLGFTETGNSFPFEVPIEFGIPKVPIYFIEMECLLDIN